MDNIDKMMKEADRLGFGVSYGKYRAAYPNSGNVVAKPAESKPPKRLAGTCRGCGKPFIKAHGTQAYCSQECSHAAARKRQNAYYKRKRLNEKKLLIISCAECGSDFRAVKITQKYCCPECAKAGNRKAAAGWRAAQKNGGI